MVLSANAVLRGRSNNKPSWSVYFGYDYVTNGERSVQMGEVHLIHAPSQAADLPNQFKLKTFSKTFHRIFSDTTVSVDGLVNLVYIFRKTLKNFIGESTTEGRVHKMLY